MESFFIIFFLKENKTMVGTRTRNTTTNVDKSVSCTLSSSSSDNITNAESSSSDYIINAESNDSNKHMNDKSLNTSELLDKINYTANRDKDWETSSTTLTTNCITQINSQPRIGNGNLRCSTSYESQGSTQGS